MSNVAVVGMGYVGIPIAVLLADAGHSAYGIQRLSERSGWKVDALNRGELPIANEPELPEILKRVRCAGRFYVTDCFAVISTCDFVLIDVQTPVDEHHQPVYDSLKDACQNVGEYLHSGAVVIIESTVAPGTTLNVVRPILEQASGLKAGLPGGFGLCFSYERVMVGKLVRNIRTLPKVIGGIDEASTEAARCLYRSVVDAEILTTDITTAEVAKVTENAYRDVQIAFANEIALLSESLKVDVHEVRRLVNSLPDRHMLLPGAGVGGHCLPKDSWLLLNGARPILPSLLVCGRKINDKMPSHIAELLEIALLDAGTTPSRSVVGVLGYAFLENSDDDRNSPSATLCKELKGRGIDYRVHDPYVSGHGRLDHDLGAVLGGADAVILMTAHDEYKALTPDYLAGLLRTKVVIDGRNVWNPQDFIDKGFIFKGIGKGKTNG